MKAELTIILLLSRTHFTPGLGSCGVNSSPSDDIVGTKSLPICLPRFAILNEVMFDSLLTLILALSSTMMAKHPCFSQISIYNPQTGTTNWATVGKVIS